MRKQSVIVTTFSDKTLFGAVMLPDGDESQMAFRLQDLMNDDRKFFPFFLEVENVRDGATEKMIIIHKDHVATIEEREKKGRESSSFGTVQWT